MKTNKIKKINTEFQDQKRTNRLLMDLMLLAVTCKEVQPHVILIYTASLLGPKGSQDHLLLWSHSCFSRLLVGGPLRHLPRTGKEYALKP